MITTTEYRSACQCPARAAHSRRFAMPKNDAIRFGSAVHELCAAGTLPDGTDPETSDLALAIYERWATEQRPKYQGDLFHEVGFYLHLAQDGTPKICTSRTRGTVIRSTVDTIGVTADAIRIYERKTTSRTDLDVVVSEYFAGPQLRIYTLLGQALKALTGKHVEIVLDVIRKATPKKPHGNKCTCARRAAGIDPQCPKCFGTGVEAISAAACDTDAESWREFARQYPHLAGEALTRAAACEAQGSTFFRLETLPLAPVPPAFVRSLRDIDRAIRKAEKDPMSGRNFSDCFGCPGYTGCIYGVWTDYGTPDKPSPISEMEHLLKTWRKK